MSTRFVPCCYPEVGAASSSSCGSRPPSRRNISIAYNNRSIISKEGYLQLEDKEVEANNESLMLKEVHGL
jgi:hypothetical protein